MPARSFIMYASNAHDHLHQQAGRLRYSAAASLVDSDTANYFKQVPPFQNYYSD